MIGKMFLRIITFLVDIVSILTAKIFVKLGLGLGFIYVVLFLIICAISHVAFSSVYIWFWLGLSVCIALGIYIEYNYGNNYKSNRRKKSNQQQNEHEYKQPSKKSFFKKKDIIYDFQEEIPMIFASRRDPTVLIYEFENRLEFYKRVKNKIIYLETRYKK